LTRAPAGICYGIGQRRLRCFLNDTLSFSRTAEIMRIPREFELPGEDAIMRKDGGRLIIEPAPPKSLLALLATLAPLHEDFPPIRDPAPEIIDL
jgi:antitoxin VapB